MSAMMYPETMEEFADWLACTAPGQDLLCREQAFFDHAVADIFGFRAVQLGLGAEDFLACSRIPWHGYAGMDGQADVVCDPAYLPFDSKSLDLLLLPHALDFTSEPHQVLREAERVLLPEGRLVLTGFNPLSLWGVSRLLYRRRGVPWCGNFVGISRLKDWMTLLQLETTATRFMAYSPPFARADWLARCRFMEQAGEYCWPQLAGVYGVVAVKRQRGMRLIMPRWQRAKPARSLAVASGNERQPINRTQANETSHE
jgi:SAM-dependent methyltransferase